MQVLYIIRFILKEFTRREFLKGGLGLFLPELEPSRAVRCPIFYFHEVFNKNQFSSFILELIDNGGVPISLNTLTTYLTTGEKKWEGDPFVITLDDGLWSQKENAFLFLVQYKIPGVFAVMPVWDGDGVHTYMDHRDFKELSMAGMEVISHTFNHANLPALRIQNRGAWESQIIESKKVLSEIIGKPVEFFCYPYGAYDWETVKLVSSYYKAALSTRPGKIQSNDELFILPRQSKS